MTKGDLVEGLTDRLGVTKAAAEKALEFMLSDVGDALARGERVIISGFGAFIVLTREARIGRNPKTGAPIEISANRAVKFKPGKQLKNLLNGTDALEQSPSPE
jgi:DNA-binding protein HU-beta